MNNIAFFISENHPYLSVIKNSSYPVIVIDPVAIDEVDYSELDEIDTEEPNLQIRAEENLPEIEMDSEIPTDLNLNQGLNESIDKEL